jgi:hypothetical protein
VNNFIETKQSKKIISILKNQKRSRIIQEISLEMAG